MAKQGGKSKRQQTPAKAQKRELSRERCRVNKAERNLEQNLRARNNRALRAAGEKTPWELSESIRRASVALRRREYELGA